MGDPVGDLGLGEAWLEMASHTLCEHTVCLTWRDADFYKLWPQLHNSNSDNE